MFQSQSDFLLMARSKNLKKNASCSKKLMECLIE